MTAEKICNQMTYFLLPVPVYVYEYYRIEKQEIFRILLMLPLCHAVVPVSCSFFQQFVRSQSLTFIRKFLNKLLAQ